MATAKELAARYVAVRLLAARYRAAYTRMFNLGDEVRVKPSHGFKHWHGDTGTIDKFVPINKVYVELDEHGRQILDLDDLEKVDTGKGAGLTLRDVATARTEVVLRDRDIAPFGTVGVLDHWEGHLPRMPRGASVKTAMVDDAYKEAAFPFLRDSKFGTLSLAMSAAAKKEGVLFGMRDVASILKSWFDNREPANDKEDAGFKYLKSPAGQKIFNGIIAGVQKALKATGARVGVKDVGEVIVAFAEDK